MRLPREPRATGYHAGVVLRALVDEERKIPPEALEGIAQSLHDRAGLEAPFPYPLHLVEALNLQLLRHPTATCGQGSLIAGVLVVCPSGNERTLGLRVLHELAHAELEDVAAKAWAAGRDFDFSHGDVWLLALMLAVPRRALRRPTRELRSLVWVPGWAVDLRLTVATAVARGH